MIEALHYRKGETLWIELILEKEELEEEYQKLTAELENWQERIEEEEKQREAIKHKQDVILWDSDKKIIHKQQKELNQLTDEENSLKRELENMKIKEDNLNKEKNQLQQHEREIDEAKRAIQQCYSREIPFNQLQVDSFTLFPLAFNPLIYKSNSKRESNSTERSWKKAKLTHSYNSTTSTANRIRTSTGYSLWLCISTTHANTFSYSSLYLFTTFSLHGSCSRTISISSHKSLHILFDTSIKPLSKNPSM